MANEFRLKKGFVIGGDGTDIDTSTSINEILTTGPEISEGTVHQMVTASAVNEFVGVEIADAIVNDIEASDVSTAGTSVNAANVQTAIDRMWSPTSLEGLGVTLNEATGEATVAAGSCVLRTGATSEIDGELKTYDITTETIITVPDGETVYIYLESYSTPGVPQVQSGADFEIITADLRNHVIHTVSKTDGLAEMGHVTLLQQGVNFMQASNVKDSLVDGIVKAKGFDLLINPNKTFTISAGMFYMMNLQIVTEAYNTANLTRYKRVYKTSSGWSRTAGLSVIDFTKYNDRSTGLLANINNGEYGVHWLFCEFNNPSRIAIMFGENTYTLSGAQEAKLPTIVPNELDDQGTGYSMWKIIIKADGTVAELTDLKINGSLLGNTPTIHNELDGLNDGDYQHLTVSEKSDIDDHLIDTNIHVPTPTTAGKLLAVNTLANGTEWIDPSTLDQSKIGVFSNVAELQSLITEGKQVLYFDSKSHQFENFAGTITVPEGISLWIYNSHSWEFIVNGVLNFVWDGVSAGDLFFDRLTIRSSGELKTTNQSGGGGAGRYLTINTLSFEDGAKITNISSVHVYIGLLKTGLITNLLAFHVSLSLFVEGFKNCSLASITGTGFKSQEFWKTPHDDSKQDDLGFGDTAGKVLATNATLDGTEWIAAGDMTQSVYDVDNDISGVVDSSNKNVIKTLNLAGAVNTLTAMTSGYDENPIGVLIDTQGVAVTLGPVKLKVYNRSSGLAALQIGAYVYMDRVDNNTYGAVKKVTPGGQLKMGDDDVYIGTVAVATPQIALNASALVEILLDIRKNSIENPTAEGSWLRKNENDINSWTEDINGGSY